MSEVEGSQNQLNHIPVANDVEPEANNSLVSGVSQEEINTGVPAGNEASQALPLPDTSATTVGASPAQIVEEFQYLLEKSTQIFSGLRDLPQTGKSWQPYFQKAFEVYTKLWKFQQQQRAILESKDYFGLKRWEIGEIASKIGQLYYHYYLRTSETNYLYESYVFYEAIRDRAYFRDVLNAGTPSLVIKKLRYYARFIVASLLLNKYDTIRVLIDELSELVENYTKIYKPTDSAEWSLVLSEITTFVNMERRLAPSSTDGQIFAVPVRLQTSTHTDAGRLRLQEAVLVGNCAHQIKFSELTIDMYRMLQSLEREPAVGGKAATAPDDASQKPRRSHPHKYLLYKPTFYQLLVYLATAFKDVSDNSALMLYLSADAGFSDEASDVTSGSVASLFSGGVQTSRPAKGHAESPADDAAFVSKVNSLHPGDLLPFSRKPLFIIIDSFSGGAFKAFSTVFKEQTVILMSPTSFPPSLGDVTQMGSPFTLFLHSPLKALRHMTGSSSDITLETWTGALTKLSQLETSAEERLNGSDETPLAVKLFLQDDFGAKFLVRYILCAIVFKAHKEFAPLSVQPTIYPSLPESMYATSSLIEGIEDLVSYLGLSSFFDFSTVKSLTI